MQIDLVAIAKPDDVNVVVGQAHFIKTVDDLARAISTAAPPSARFAVAFCEASGKRLVRRSGTQDGLIEMATQNASRIAAGHSFIVFLGDGFFPINVLNTIKGVPEVCRIFCATANPTQVLIAETDQGRGIIGIVDGMPPLGVEAEDDVRWRKDLLRAIGYKA